jgi:hypothetical protein
MCEQAQEQLQETAAATLCALYVLRSSCLRVHTPVLLMLGRQ